MENQKEIWKDIEGYEGLYQISNLGRVKSLGRVVLKKNGVIQPIPERILRPSFNSLYPCVSLSNKNYRTKTIHELIAKAFIPNPEKKRTINHKDGNKKNNDINNLEWATHSENHLHAYRELNRKHAFLNKFGKDHHRSKAVLQFAIDGKFIDEYGSQREANRITKIEQTNISSVCLGKLKSAGGYIWKFKEQAE